MATTTSLAYTIPNPAHLSAIFPISNGNNVKTYTANIQRGAVFFGWVSVGKMIHETANGEFDQSLGWAVAAICSFGISYAARLQFIGESNKQIIKDFTDSKSRLNDTLALIPVPMPSPFSFHPQSF